MEYGLILRVNHDRLLNTYAVQIKTDNGEILCETGHFSHEADAIYTALHQLAVLNNFTGCLK